MRYFEVLAFFILSFLVFTTPALAEENMQSFEFQSVDTMKYSRDLAREKLNDVEFEKEIEIQIKQIKDLGANYVAIDTPYDAEFLPFLKKWVKVARANNLKIWFRGNWSNWEGWFGHERKMTTGQHILKSQEFITSNPELFEDGDYFTACPECENGSLGDPRRTGKVSEYRKFLIAEVTGTEKAFKKINKKVKTNLLSTNYDVAKLIFDKDTTKSTGGVVVIDHYVQDAKQLRIDVENIARESGGKVLLGEFGAPILDIHGNFNEKQQASWINSALEELSQSKNLIGLNYWVSKGGSTALYNNDNSAKQGVEILKRFFHKKFITGTVHDSEGKVVEEVTIKTDAGSFKTENGHFKVSYFGNKEIEVSSDKYKVKTIKIADNEDGVGLNVILERKKEPWYAFIFSFLPFLKTN